jgi:L-fuculose-phosphate aldolase
MGIYEELADKREEVAYFMRRLYKKNLTTCSGGNLSLRGPDDLILLTPSSLDKGELRADQILLMRMNGENLTPHLKPTIEVGIHIGVLKRRPEMNAVVHAHPVHATAFACMNLEIDISLYSEVYLLVERITQSEFAPPGTNELAERVAESMATANVSLMKNHGVITTGPTMLKAFDLMEVTESTAKMNFIARSLGASRPLSEKDKDILNGMFTRGA